MSEFVRFKVRLHVSNLYVSLIWFQFARIHRIRVLYYNYILRAKSLGVKVLESRKYFREFRQGWLFVDKLFAGKIAESGAVKTNSEIRAKDAFAGQLFNACICLVKFATQFRKNILCIYI